MSGLDGARRPGYRGTRCRDAFGTPGHHGDPEGVLRRRPGQRRQRGRRTRMRIAEKGDPRTPDVHGLGRVMRPSKRRATNQARPSAEHAPGCSRAARLPIRSGRRRGGRSSNPTVKREGARRRMTVGRNNSVRLYASGYGISVACAYCMRTRVRVPRRTAVKVSSCITRSAPVNLRGPRPCAANDR